MVGAAQHVDPTVRKTCIHSVTHMCVFWASRDPSTRPNSLPQLLFDRLAVEACLKGLLVGGLDHRDGGVFSLVVEAATSLKQVYDMAGESFVQFLVQNNVLSGQCGMSVENANALVDALRKGDPKLVRKALRETLTALGKSREQQQQQQQQQQQVKA